jgi:hypothetical protein
MGEGMGQGKTMIGEGAKLNHCLCMKVAKCNSLKIGGWGAKEEINLINVQYMHV